MAHIKINMRADGTGRLLVEGRDLSNHVMRDSLRVAVEDDLVVVHCTLMADELDADLADAVLTAARSSDVIER